MEQSTGMSAPQLPPTHQRPAGINPYSMGQDIPGGFIINQEGKLNNRSRNWNRSSNFCFGGWQVVLHICICKSPASPNVDWFVIYKRPDGDLHSLPLQGSLSLSLPHSSCVSINTQLPSNYSEGKFSSPLPSYFSSFSVGVSLSVENKLISAPTTPRSSAAPSSFVSSVVTKRVWPTHNDDWLSFCFLHWHSALIISLLMPHVEGFCLPFLYHQQLLRGT